MGLTLKNEAIELSQDAQKIWKEDIIDSLDLPVSILSILHRAAKLESLIVSIETIEALEKSLL